MNFNKVWKSFIVVLILSICTVSAQAKPKKSSLKNCILTELKECKKMHASNEMKYLDQLIEIVGDHDFHHEKLLAAFHAEVTNSYPSLSANFEPRRHPAFYEGQMLFTKNINIDNGNAPVFSDLQISISIAADNWDLRVKDLEKKFKTQGVVSSRFRGWGDKSNVEYTLDKKDTQYKYSLNLSFDTWGEAKPEANVIGVQIYRVE